MLPYDRKLKQFSKTLRSNMTDAERYLWQRIRNRQLCGVQFYRQKPLLSFIVDFYCPTAKLVVELDGGQHFESAHQVTDRERDKQLAGIGLRVLRFDDRQVLTETDAVLEVIYVEVVRRLKENSPPLAPRCKRGELHSPLCKKGAANGVSGEF